jgi:uncharacterized membrane-anchored protein YhcB (DUF1043 family)
MYLLVNSNRYEISMVVSDLVMSSILTIPISVGDLIDRITILKIKSHRIKNENQLEHVHAELGLLMLSHNKIKDFFKNYSEMMDKLENELMDVNANLWDYENQIRQQVNDTDIAKTAKAITHANDLRASIKYKINVMLGSPIVEEKSYSK